jgi:hypothetical protein
MKLIKLVLPLLACLTLASCGKDDYPPIEIMQSSFAIATTDKDGKTLLTETNKVPLIEGQRYGWRIWFRGNQEEIKYGQTLVLSDKATFNVGQKDKDGRPVKSIEIMDGKGIYVSREVPNNGLLTGAWGVSKDDPPGKSQITVYMNKKPIHTFNFELVPETPKERK